MLVTVMHERLLTLNFDITTVFQVFCARNDCKRPHEQIIVRYK